LDLTCDEGYKKEEIKCKDRKRNAAKGIEGKAIMGVSWFLSEKITILVFSSYYLLPCDSQGSLIEQTVKSD
jgi:hypothetical protein